ncbi:hypothetical protein RchiOBHm_Chr2g0136321 [Rosa chinensis]|uniref:Transmembrane protein n=1 Tax=Rosa chinensis TaxID=74649 RepID=A0A2P6RW98_ROSCH|nr:hypothetical protein RchiOBHm_Chr2g0136321 [Rosa chinensis]
MPILEGTGSDLVFLVLCGVVSLMRVCLWRVRAVQRWSGSARRCVDAWRRHGGGWGWLIAAVSACCACLLLGGGLGAGPGSWASMVLVVGAFGLNSSL